MQFPRVTDRVTITPLNFSTAVAIRVAFNPWLVVLKTSDGMAKAPSDYSQLVQDNDTDTSAVLSSMSTPANGDWLLIGAHVPFRGVYFDMDGTNGAGTATVVVYYWNGTQWVTTSATVTGIRSSRIFDQDGLAYWTVPSAWTPSTITQMYPNTNFSIEPYYQNVPIYWTKWELDAAISDTSVTVDRMYAANRSTSYMELVSGQMVSKDIYQGFGGTGCVEARTDAGTANLVVNAMTAGMFE